MSHVIACIDGSASAPAVCDYAAWASLRLAAPLTFLHVIDRRRYPVATDLTGNIGLGSREHLLAELAALDEQRGRLALEQGRIMLAAARERAIAAGMAEPQSLQRHGDLFETLRERESEIRLLVLGRQGESGAGGRVGSQLEGVIRRLQRPVLVTPISFSRPTRVLLAFDGSATMRRAVETLAASPLLAGLPMHIVMVGPPSDEAAAQLDWARTTLGNAGFSVRAERREGDVEAALHACQREHDIDLLVMGAYGHSRIRQFLIGSTTTVMLRSTTTPLLLLR